MARFLVARSAQKGAISHRCASSRSHEMEPVRSFQTVSPRTPVNRGKREGWVQGKPTSSSGKEKEPLGGLDPGPTDLISVILEVDAGAGTDLDHLALQNT